MRIVKDLVGKWIPLNFSGITHLLYTNRCTIDECMYENYQKYQCPQKIGRHIGVKNK